MKLLKTKKGEVGPIGAIFLFLVFIVIWLIWLASWIGEVGATVVTENSLTGVEAFFFSNLNLMIFICLVLGMLGFLYFMGD